MGNGGLVKCLERRRRIIALEVWTKSQGLPRRLDRRLLRRRIGSKLNRQMLLHNATTSVGGTNTSLVDECSMRIFFPVMICTKTLVSKCLISMKL